MRPSNAQEELGECETVKSSALSAKGALIGCSLMPNPKSSTAGGTWLSYVFFINERVASQKSESV